LRIKFNLKLFSRYSATKSNLIFTVSKFSQQEIVKHYNIPENKIIVAYEACDPTFHHINNDSTLSDFRKRYSLVEDYILYVGSTFKRRNVDSLIKAFKIVSRQLPKSQLVLIGKITDNNIRQLMEDQLVSNRIIQFNFVEDKELNLFYNAAGVFVYPSSYEGFGLPPLEAMSCGIPVIVAASSSLPEVVGNAGIFIEPRDPKDIADKICKVLSEDNLRNDLIIKCMNQAEKFSWSRCSRKIYEALDAVVNPCYEL